MAFPSLEWVRTAAVLTASYVAGTDLEIADANQVLLFLIVNKTASNLASVELTCEIVIAAANDRHFQELSALTSNGVVHLRPVEYKLDVTSLAAIAYLYLPIPISGDKVRISAKGTVAGGSTFGTLSIQAALGRV